MFLTDKAVRKRMRQLTEISTFKSSILPGQCPWPVGGTEGNDFGDFICLVVYLLST